MALLAVAYLLPGITVASFGSALIAALVLGLVNMLVKPVLVLLTLPITIVTLGLFLIVINALLFWFVGSVLKGFQVNGFWWAVGSDPLQHHLRPADQADPLEGAENPEALCASLGMPADRRSRIRGIPMGSRPERRPLRGFCWAVLAQRFPVD